VNRAVKPSLPLYQRLKNHIVAQVESGAWLPGHRIPSEHELARRFNASRMTVNRALRELADRGLLNRVAGAGTYVSEMHGQSHLLEIRNIADEVRARGHEYATRVISVRRTAAPAAVARDLELRKGAKVFHSVVLHLENHVPIQLEDRYVNAAVVPGYGDVDFAEQTPAEYLLRVAPLQQVEHTVHARMPDARTRRLLHMEEGEPCLVVFRRTWSRGKVATVATLSHPGKRFRLTGQYRPS
jgi:GntR family histidine utilization transcriptional repressor